MILKRFFLYLFFLIPISFIAYNFYVNQGYWYDEWATLYSSNPFISNEIIDLRIKGITDGTYSVHAQENVPKYYYLTLREFFNIFGFTAENGRLFSLIFYFFNIVLLYLISNFFLTKNNKFLFILLVFTNPFLIWMSNETRADTFLIFFVLLNLISFLNCYKFKKNFFNLLALYLSTLFMLSVYPLTFSIFFSEIIFILYLSIIYKKKYGLVLLILIFSFCCFIYFNQEYLFLRVTAMSEHYAVLNIKFFISFFFNKFFGSVFFGIIFLLIILFLILKNNKIIYKNKDTLFLTMLVFFTYSMVISSSIFVTPIVAPRYIIFLVPIILLWIVKNVEIYNKSYFKFFWILVFLSLSNLILTNHLSIIKKPPISKALQIIKEQNYFYILSSIDNWNERYYGLYLSTLKRVQNEEFKVVKLNDVKSNSINNFVYLCIYNARFRSSSKILDDERKCRVDFTGYKLIKREEINDFLISFYKKI